MLVVFETKTYTNYSSRVMTDYSISRQLSFEKNTLDSISAFIDHDLNSHTYIIRNGISEESVPKDRKPKKENVFFTCYRGKCVLGQKKVRRCLIFHGVSGINRRSAFCFVAQCKQYNRKHRLSFQNKLLIQLKSSDKAEQKKTGFSQRLFFRTSTRSLSRCS